MSKRSEFSQLPIAERDLRWSRIRDRMAAQRLDLLLFHGNSSRWNDMNANVRYVCNYADPLSGVDFALLPLLGDGTLVTQMIPKRSVDSICWFDDVRSGQTSRIADILVERLTALNLVRGTVGVVGLRVMNPSENIGLPWNYMEEIRDRLPNVRLVDATEMIVELRSVKSESEIHCLEESARIAEVALLAHRDLCRPGVTERELYFGLLHSMHMAGADPLSFLLLESGPLSGEWLTLDPIPSNRVVQPADYVVSEVGPKYAGYEAQGIQCVIFGSPTREMLTLLEYASEVWATFTGMIRPGNTFEQVLHAADDVIERARGQLGALADALRPSLRFAGLGGPDPMGESTMIAPSQAFTAEIGAGGRPWKPPWRMSGGYCIVSTDEEPRHLCGASSIEDRLMIVAA